MNRVVLVGRLARDPNMLRRSLTNNGAAISFTIAVDSKSNKEDHQAEFIPCVAFNRTAEFVDTYFRKGLQVGIDGRLQSRSYDKDGSKVYVTEVVCESVTILDKKDDNSPTVSSESSTKAPRETTSEESSSDEIGIDVRDVDLPF